MRIRPGLLLMISVLISHFTPLNLHLATRCGAAQ